MSSRKELQSREWQTVLLGLEATVLAFVSVLISILKVRARSTSRKEVIRRQGTRRRHGDDAAAATTTTTRRGGGGGIDVKFSWTSDTARRLLHYKSRAAVAAPTLLPPTLPRSIPNAGQVSPPRTSVSGHLPRKSTSQTSTPWT